MAPITLACVVGARPNFMKMAPILRAFDAYPQISPVLVHSGQHYDANLSDVFFDELEMKKPEISLEVGSGKHGEQTARVLERFEAVLEQRAPSGRHYDAVVVVGDVNSTMAATLAAVKLGIRVAHVEAGLRSFDRTMPEEINRIVTDSVSELLFVSEPAGIENLRREGHPDSRLHLVGNVMIDSLIRLLPRASARDTLQRFQLRPSQYGVVTLHRPSNVDDAQTLTNLVDVLVQTAAELPLVFPVHPRTFGRFREFGLMGKLESTAGIIQLPPLGYLDFLALTSQARLIVTDSGGLQEESTALRVPCLTMRANTERPITVAEGSSTLVGSDAELLRSRIRDVLSGNYSVGTCPPLWDGHAADRIAAVLAG